MKKLILCAAVLFAGSASAQVVWDNFDNERNCNYGFIHGTLMQAVPNPDATGVNTSANVATYIRNQAETFDVIVIESVSYTHLTLPTTSRV